ncbi:MAG: M56 family metallopeptidase [Gemmatimonadales bacterium]
MIAAWMVYCMGIGLAFVVVGYALERGLHFAGRPTRWAWIVALVGSYLVPAAAWVRPDAVATVTVPIAALESPTISPSSIARESSRLTLTDLDTPLRWSWGLASLAILAALTVAARRLAVICRHWRSATIDGRSVLISENVGPAVVGVWTPHLVLPEWALLLPPSDRELMLTHEQQHVRAADPALLALAFLLVFLAPWNLALWWQWRRLRLAVEIDCDARVLAEGRSPVAYGQLLLQAGRRRSPQLVGAAALGEPASFLEVRLRRLIRGLPRWRWVGAVAAISVAVGVVVGACETPRPAAPTTSRVDLTGAGVEGGIGTGIVPIRDEVFMESVVEERPQFLAGRQPQYPDLLRKAGVEGRVIVQAIIDTTGRAEPRSVKVLQSPHPGFDQSARNFVLGALFRPARVHGRAVRVLVNLPIDFKLNGRPLTARTTRPIGFRLRR